MGAWLTRRVDGFRVLPRSSPGLGGARSCLWVYRRVGVDDDGTLLTDTRFERVTFIAEALPLRQSVEGGNTHEDAAAVPCSIRASRTRLY